MGRITRENTPLVLTKLRRNPGWVRRRPVRAVTENDIEIAREWLSRLPQHVLDDPCEPIEADDVLEIAGNKCDASKPDESDVLKLAAYEVMIDRIYEVLTSCIGRTASRREARRRRPRSRVSRGR